MLQSQTLKKDYKRKIAQQQNTLRIELLGIRKKNEILKMKNKDMRKI